MTKFVPEVYQVSGMSFWRILSSQLWFRTSALTKLGSASMSETQTIVCLSENWTQSKGILVSPTLRSINFACYRECQNVLIWFARLLRGPLILILRQKFWLFFKYRYSPDLVMHILFLTLRSNQYLVFASIWNNDIAPILLVGGYSYSTCRFLLTGYQLGTFRHECFDCLRTLCGGGSERGVKLAERSVERTQVWKTRV